MIKASSRRPGDPTGDLERLLQDYLRLGEQVYRGVLRPSWALGRALWAGSVGSSGGGACDRGWWPSGSCDIPETECPPRCVCELVWEAQPRDTVRGMIRITNTGPQPQPFSFTATSLQGDGQDTGIRPDLDPATAHLAPGESATVRVTLPLHQGFATGRVYEGEVLVRGRYEQCVRLRVQVEPEPVPHCEVRQGEIPVRVRAHHWYHHFQCEEPCFRPVGRQPQEPDHRPDPTP